MALISDFLSKVQNIHGTGKATEHSYRSAFERLFSNLGVTALNEPKRVRCGAPDFILQKGEIVIGHLEAKDLQISIRREINENNKIQQERYKAALPNLIYTNGLDWDFYRNGNLMASATIAKFFRDGVIPKPDQYARLENLLYDFIAQHPQTITNPRELAERMAGKASLIKDVLHNTLLEDDNSRTEIAAQYKAFKENLIQGINTEDFADIYAETIAYGMFAARLHDITVNSFSRQKALELLPKSNPFLRSLFSYVAGSELDDRIAWIIDDLADIFQACNITKLMKGFGKLTSRNDPFLHFYETFLTAYNPSKRKARGVWYTPEPIVNFIVRAIDELLQTEFELADGLADTSKVTIDWNTGKADEKGENIIIKKEVHRVQILDPAAGTGTFLAEVVKQIAPKIRDIAPSMWSHYIEQDLMPRLHGFEILMASYAMCHMKLDMILTEMGYKPTGAPPRLSVYLTNSLEDGEPVKQNLPFAQWFSREAKGAKTIKRDMPIMCVIGNPPYSSISHNTGEWITKMIEDYKYVDGVHFGERRHWLHDDYVKFIRLSESLINKNGEGILGFITNHGYLDNPTFRGMRWHLLNSFNKIYILDLHGNAQRRETTPEGNLDRNVFDIRQGVAIIIAVKTHNKKEELAEVYHGDLWGTRENKYSTLTTSKIGKSVTKRISCVPPQYTFASKDYEMPDIYEKGFKLTDFMHVNITGIVTARDALVIDFTKQELRDKINRFIDSSKTDDQARSEFFSDRKAGEYSPGDTRGWKLPYARSALQNADWVSDIKPITYRPFDIRSILYRPDMVDWGRFDKMAHLFRGQNIALIFSRQAVRQDAPPVNVFVTPNVFNNRGVYTNRGISQAAPLYLYPNENSLDQTIQVNFDSKMYRDIQKLAHSANHDTPNEVAVFDYIYGVLHCPAYRQIFAEFLKIDFPRIPWPTSPNEFWHVSTKGTKLRKLHLMDPAVVGQASYPLMGESNNVVDNPHLKDGKIWINASQYFDNVPDNSWDFYICGYQPAQKWLKDRSGRTLGLEDVNHYQRIIKILAETDKIMRTINMALSEGS